MTASLRRTVIVSVAALGVAFLLVWAASSGPVLLAGDQQQPRSVTSQGEQGQPPAPDGETRTSDEEETASPDPGISGTTSWAQDLAAFALLAVTLAVLGLVVRLLLQRVARALPEKQLVLELEPRPDAEAGRAAIARDRDHQEQALARSDVRNGIVACWVLMEEAAAEAGVTRRPSETATELVVRFLHALDVDPRPVAELARLYHEARFSTHPMGAAARSRARQALDSIHRELAQAAVAP